MASPSVKTLHTISQALGVSIVRFFDDDEGDERESQYVVRKSRRRHIKFAAGIDDYQLTSHAVGHLTLLYCTFAPGATLNEDYTHQGEEAGFVASGRLELYLDDTHITLEAGDAFCFSSDLPHRYRNPGKSETVVIWAMTTASSRHHDVTNGPPERRSRSKSAS
jgi:quercetin dioxygenase-like cupin family protein